MLRVLDLYDGPRPVGQSIWFDGSFTDIRADGVRYGGELYSRAEINDLAGLRFVQVPRCDDRCEDDILLFPCADFDHDH